MDASVILSIICTNGEWLIKTYNKVHGTLFMYRVEFKVSHLESHLDIQFTLGPEHLDASSILALTGDNKLLSGVMSAINPTVHVVMSASKQCRD